MVICTLAMFMYRLTSFEMLKTSFQDVCLVSTELKIVTAIVHQHCNDLYKMLQ